MGSQPNKNMKNQKQIDLKHHINNVTRPRSTPICPYNPNLINPPEDNDTITMAENFDEV
ncbi:unnamed protein product [Paramecium primaurelia]|uniref:Uncharacterized protein n=1 Tax=Paramecium primaurelia TaxID=5886 RepID=A0A8S1P1B1_PARPR|nr:unnamed protein product [Paramecium primaurelia]